MAEEAAKGPGRKSVLKHVDTVGALPSLECGRGRGTARQSPAATRLCGGACRRTWSWKLSAREV